MIWLAIVVVAVALFAGAILTAVLVLRYSGTIPLPTRARQTAHGAGRA